MLRILSRTAAAVTLLFSLSACYVTESAVLPASSAEEIPGIEGTWQAVGGEAEDTIVIERVAGSNEYLVTAAGEEETLNLHGFNLVDGIYMLEVYDENAPGEGAIIAFVQIDGETLSVMTPTGDPQALAGQAGVDLGDDNIEVFGEPSAVLQFVQLHADTAFAPQPMMERVQ